LYNLARALVVAKYKALKDRKTKCSVAVDSNGPTAACSAANLCKHKRSGGVWQNFACSSSGAASVPSTAPKMTCEYDDMLESTYATNEKARMEVILGQAAASKIAPIENSCETIAVKATCEAATLSAAEAADLTAAVTAADGSADGAVPMSPCTCAALFSLVLLSASMSTI